MRKNTLTLIIVNKLLFCLKSKHIFEVYIVYWLSYVKVNIQHELILALQISIL